MCPRGKSSSPRDKVCCDGVATWTYTALDVTDRPSKHILYVARTKAPGQTRTVYLAFDYSGINTDVSDIRVIDGAHDNMDKCESDDFQEAAAEVLTNHRSVSRQNDWIAEI